MHSGCASLASWASQRSVLRAASSLQRLLIQAAAAVGANTTNGYGMGGKTLSCPPLDCAEIKETVWRYRLAGDITF